MVHLTSPRFLLLILEEKSFKVTIEQKLNRTHELPRSLRIRRFQRGSIGSPFNSSGDFFLLLRTVYHSQKSLCQKVQWPIGLKPAE
jgi:hypothetical protein